MFKSAAQKEFDNYTIWVKNLKKKKEIKIKGLKQEHLIFYINCIGRYIKKKHIFYTIKKN